jgi:predicted ester cyclase
VQYTATHTTEAHDGVFQGIPATGKRYDLAAMTVWRFTGGKIAEEKIAEEWVFSNDLCVST